MKNYKSEVDIKELVLQINGKLKEVEVKGDSVEKLFMSEILLKQLYESLEELPVEEELQGEEK